MPLVVEAVHWKILIACIVLAFAIHGHPSNQQLKHAPRFCVGHIHGGGANVEK